MTAALIWAGGALSITAIVALAGLKAWRRWLDLKRFEIVQQQQAKRHDPDPVPAVRIEMANLKERLRKLEAIAQGVDL